MDIISWDNLFMGMAHLTAKRSKDPSTKCGAVLVDYNNVILSTGFNGPPSNIDDSFVPWNTRPHKYSYIYHAEENAIDFALENGRCVEGSTLYITHHPCTDCTLKIVRFGISKVVIPYDCPDYQLANNQCVQPYEIIQAMKRRSHLTDSHLIHRMNYKRES